MVGPVLRGTVVAFDVETTALEYRHGRVFCWAYITELGEYGFMENTPRNRVWLQRLLNDPTKKVVGHNLKYDLKMLHKDGVNVLDALCEYHDTLILAKMFNGLMPSYELRWLVSRFLKRSLAGKDKIMDWLKANKRRFMLEHGREPNFSDAPREVVKERVLWDVESTLLLFKLLYKRVMANCPDLYNTERDVSCRVVVDMETTGVEIDISRAKLLRAQCKAGLALTQRDLNYLVAPLTIKKKKRGQWIDLVLHEFNPGSSATQLPAAFNKLGIPLVHRTKPKKDKKTGKMKGGGNWSFDEFAMMQYAHPLIAPIIRDSGEEGWPFNKFYDAVHEVVRENGLDKKHLLVPLVLKQRELGKMVSTYYDHLITECVNIRREPSGREVGTLHGSFNPSQAKTGRFSSSGPNLQNMPRILGPRECFIPRRGRRWWHFDYVQVEMKFFCHFAQDPEMAKAIEGDFHLYIATEIYDKTEAEVTKEQRKRAKGVSFGILYGAGPPKMAETMTKKGLPTTDLEASVICAAYHRRFPSVRRLTSSMKRELLANGYITNPFGRRYHIIPSEGYKCLNYVCQGTPADLMKQRMLRVWRWLRSQGLRSKIVLQVHDELALECPPSEEARVVPEVQRMMEDRTNYFVPITVDREVVTHRWSKKYDPAKLNLNYN